MKPRIQLADIAGLDKKDKANLELLLNLQDVRVRNAEARARANERTTAAYAGRVLKLQAALLDAEQHRDRMHRELYDERDRSARAAAEHEHEDEVRRIHENNDHEVATYRNLAGEANRQRDRLQRELNDQLNDNDELRRRVADLERQLRDRRT